MYRRSKQPFPPSRIQVAPIARQNAIKKEKKKERKRVRKNSTRRGFRHFCITTRQRGRKTYEDTPRQPSTHSLCCARTYIPTMHIYIYICVAACELEYGLRKLPCTSAVFNPIGGRVYIIIIYNTWAVVRVQIEGLTAIFSNPILVQVRIPHTPVYDLRQ